MTFDSLNDNDTSSYFLHVLFRNKYYQLGDGTNQDRGDDSNEMGNALATVEFGSTFIPVDVAAGAEHVCAISQTKEVKCWGQSIHSVLFKMHMHINAIQFDRI